MFPKQLFTLAALLLPVLAAPSALIPVSKVASATPGRYIVILKDGVSRASHISSIQSNTLSASSEVTHEFSIINGYAGKFSTDDLNELRANSDIASIEEDGRSHKCDTVTQTSAPWGLARISSLEKLSGDSGSDDFVYHYDDTAGTGTVVYIIDTGIYIAHEDFGGRASWGKTFGDYSDGDADGHGTHCAGTAVSKTYGVAKSANVVAVKVLGDDGNGQNSDIISGLDWVAEQAKESGAPSIASLSLSGDTSISVDDAVKALFTAGITVVAAAGNDAKDADDISPANIPEVITVGASNFDDEMADFSNFGASLDLFAPGENIISTWIDGETETSSGTSMAASHVAGYAAYLLGMDSSLTPAGIASTIGGGALSDALGKIPAGTANKLLNNGL